MVLIFEYSLFQVLPVVNGKEGSGSNPTIDSANASGKKTEVNGNSDKASQQQYPPGGAKVNKSLSSNQLSRPRPVSSRSARALSALAKNGEEGNGDFRSN